MLVETADALLRGEMPSREARLWFGSAISAWLESGDGPLDRHLGIRAPRGSHHRPQVLARLIADERRRTRVKLCSRLRNTKEPE
jgi:hypothetical protein